MSSSESSTYDVAYIAGVFNPIFSSLKNPGSSWKSDKIPYTIHNTKEWFILAENSYPARGSHFVRFKKLEHAIRLLIWVDKKLGSDKNAPVPNLSWTWESVQDQPRSVPKASKAELSLQAQVQDLKNESKKLKDSLKKADEKIKSLSAVLAEATSKDAMLAELQRRNLHLEEQYLRIVEDNQERGYRLHERHVRT